MADCSDLYALLAQPGAPGGLAAPDTGTYLTKAIETTDEERQAALLSSLAL